MGKHWARIYLTLPVLPGCDGKHLLLTLAVQPAIFVKVKN
jgi:hypothetical protein